MSDPLFWERLVDMHPHEADALLRRRRTELVEAKIYAEGRQQTVLDVELTRVNDEIHLLSQRMNRVRWAESVKEVLGQEALEQVLEYMERRRHAEKK